jgi:hypothetical protein
MDRDRRVLGPSGCARPSRDRVVTRTAEPRSDPAARSLPDTRAPRQARSATTPASSHGRQAATLAARRTLVDAPLASRDPFEVLDRIRDPAALRGMRRRRRARSSSRPAGPTKRLAGAVLLIAWLLAYEHDLGVAGPLPQTVWVARRRADTRLQRRAAAPQRRSIGRRWRFGSSQRRDARSSSKGRASAHAARPRSAQTGRWIGRETRARARVHPHTTDRGAAVCAAIASRQRSGARDGTSAARRTRNPRGAGVPGRQPRAIRSSRPGARSTPVLASVEGARSGCASCWVRSARFKRDASPARDTGRPRRPLRPSMAPRGSRRPTLRSISVAPRTGGRVSRALPYCP